VIKIIGSFLRFLVALCRLMVDNANVLVNLYSALSHGASDALKCWDMLKQMRLLQATKAGDVEIWIAQIVA